jgi:hypothetical protein
MLASSALRSSPALPHGNCRGSTDVRIVREDDCSTASSVFLTKQQAFGGEFYCRLKRGITRTLPTHYNATSGGFSIRAVVRSPPSLSTVEEKMTCHEKVRIENGQLFVYGKSVLSGLPDNILLTRDKKAGSANGAFLGFHSLKRSHRHTVPIGVLQ